MRMRPGAAGSIHVMSSRAWRAAVRLSLVLGVAVYSGAAGSALAAGKSFEVELEGTWFLIIHYKDESATYPERERWADKVWKFDKKGSRMQWDEYPIVVFEDQSGRFEAVNGNPRSRVLAFWEPNNGQLATLQEGPRVNERGMKSKSLRGSNEKGWGSTSRMSTVGALTVGYVENVYIEGVDGLPVFRRVEEIGPSSAAKKEGLTEYRVSEISEDGAEMRGSYERDAILHGTFRLIRTAPVRGLEQKKGTPNERQAERARQEIQRRIESGDY
jgi:hypothetical protein